MTDLSLVTARDLAERTLRRLIVDGTLAPGERLNEVAIAQDAGISRGPLREAIQRLASEGLLQVVTHKGAYVRRIRIDELRDLYHVRCALESYALRMLIEKADPSALDQLTIVLEASQAEVSSHTGYPLDLDFHSHLIRLSDNAALLRAWSDVHARISLARARSGGQDARAHDALDEHREVLDAIQARDAIAGRKALERHLWASFDNASTLLDQDMP